MTDTSKLHPVAAISFDDKGNPVVKRLAPDKASKLGDLLAKRAHRAAKSINGEPTAEETRDRLRLALQDRFGQDLYVSDFTASWVVYEVYGQNTPGLYAVTWMDDPGSGGITFGTPLGVERHSDYTPVGKSEAILKVGARNNKSDAATIQSMHDGAVALGASCDMAKSTGAMVGWNEPETGCLLIPNRVVKAKAGPVLKSDQAKRYTFGPLYKASPEVPVTTHLDAHKDFATADDIQPAVWDYVRKGDRTIRLQHTDDTAIGEMVEIVCWPVESTWDVPQPDGTTVQKTYAPGTAFVGTVWSDWAWEGVQNGAITGYSLGGSAVRVAVELGD